MYWVIVSGAQPTAFRSRRSEDLLPTLRQLQRTQPDVTMKWFERGRLWDSPLAAREAQERRRDSSKGRGRDWRPGGQHADPRAKYDVPRDVRRARFKERLISNSKRERDDAKSRPPSGPANDKPAARDRWKNPDPGSQHRRPRRPAGRPPARGRGRGGSGK